MTERIGKIVFLPKPCNNHSSYSTCVPILMGDLTQDIIVLLNDATHFFDMLLFNSLLKIPEKFIKFLQKSFWWWEIIQKSLCHDEFAHSCPRNENVGLGGQPSNVTTVLRRKAGNLIPSFSSLKDIHPAIYSHVSSLKDIKTKSIKIKKVPKLFYASSSKAP